MPKDEKSRPRLHLRYRWSEAERERITAEAEKNDVTVRSVARRYGVSEGLLYSWLAVKRRQAAEIEAETTFIHCGTVKDGRLMPVQPMVIDIEQPDAKGTTKSDFDHPGLEET